MAIEKTKILGAILELPPKAELLQEGTYFFPHPFIISVLKVEY